MKDLITKGTGNSRLLKSSLTEGTSWETALAMLRAGNFPIDLAGLNLEGITQQGSPLNKESILPDALAKSMGLSQEDPLIKDALQALYTMANGANNLAKNALPKSGGTMTGKLTLNGEPTADNHAATKKYVDNNRTPAELRVLVGSNGVSVTASKGGKTLTATSGSDGWATLYPAEFGNWTVSGNSKSTVVTIDAIAVFKVALLPALANCSWATISAAAEGGVADKCFNIGDSKNFTLNGVTYAAVIIGFNHDDKTAGGKAGITFQMKECLNTTYQMESSNTNANGWKGCAMRSRMNTFLSQLNADLRAVIKPVNKKTSAGNQSTNIVTTSDSLFLLAEIEIFGATQYSKAGEGSQYAYYAAGNSRVKKVNNSASAWWERSPYGSYSTLFCLVSSSGDASNVGASSSFGVSFGFCI